MSPARCIATAYTYDPELHTQANADGRDYWYKYIGEINEQLGLRARPLALAAMDHPQELQDVSALVIGGLEKLSLTAGQKANLEAWVRSGGVLIGLGCDDLDDLFGVKCWGVWEQPENDHTVGGYLVLQSHPLCEGIVSPWHPHEKLLIFASTRLISPLECEEVARFQGHDHSDEGFAAVTARPVGKGWACYFAFDLPKTLWVLHQGKPRTYEKDGVGVFRTSHQIVTGQHHPEVLYADSLLFLLQNMLALTPQPFIYQLPPDGDQVPDAGFFWGGDDEGGAEQVGSSDFMRERGLPYHINIMASEGRFRLTPREFARIQENGHECALHYNFVEKEPYRITAEEVAEQARAYRARFGQGYITSVNHCIRWAEGAEMAVWLREAGGRADNSFCHEECTVWGGDPYNRFGFAFGTCYPFYFYRDYRYGSQRVDFLEQPWAAYELGYTRRIDDAGGEIADFPRLHRALDMALRWHLLMNLFYHPPHITKYASCRNAIDEVLRYLRRRVVVHLGNDAVWHWWDRRSASTLGDVSVDAATVKYTVTCAYPDGVITKVPLQDREARAARCDGRAAPFINRLDFGQNWGYVRVPEGRHRVEIAL